jgi:YggT family protein
MENVLCSILIAYGATLAIRAVMSWFPPPRQPLLSAMQRAVVDVTEPVLAPVRRLMPAAGPIDLSYLLVAFLVAAIISAVCNG